jgi:hypothetical protein
MGEGAVLIQTDRGLYVHHHPTMKILSINEIIGNKHV